ncbi:MAG TPA: heptaprenyl diphosphate synthase component 1 [Bacillales bacterium]|nr:heptaprenyl diphosphate synthase component 1 [Bacillales bacterium]
MNDFDIQEEVDLLKDKMKQHMHHSILLKNMDMPVPDEEKLSLLYQMFLEAECSRQEIDTYVVTIMLVQAALDAHDLITTDKPVNQKAEKSRQLTILGGDYYSGLYYQLLTELNDIALIRQIAQSIQLVNEHKMYLYRSRQALVKKVENLRVLESALLSSVAKYFNQPLWAQFFEEYFLLRRLLAQKSQFIQSQTGTDTIQDGIDHIKVFPFRQGKKQQFDPYIERAGKAVEDLFAKHSTFQKVLDSRIWSIFAESGAFKQKLAEEG